MSITRNLSCLKYVHGVVVVAEDAAASAEHHRAVALDQDRERALRRLALPRREPVQDER